MHRFISRSRVFQRLLILVAFLFCLAPVVQSVLAQDPGSDVAGDWAVSIPKDAAPRDLPNSAMLVGSWHIQFAPDGTYLAERIDLGPLVTGTWSVDGDTLTVTDSDGTLSCTQPSTSGDVSLDVASGTYSFKKSDKGLRLETKEDGCRFRSVLLSAFEMTPYIGCPIPPAGLGTLAASPVAATPIAATPEVASRQSATVEAEIDQFLGQLTACWLTGNADRFLPLLTPDFQSEFLSGGIESDANPSQQARALSSAMGVPLIFERAGNVRQVRDNEVTCIVRTELGGQESFARFRFVRQDDGRWLWDGPA